MHPTLSAVIAGERARDRRREADVARLARGARRRSRPVSGAGLEGGALTAMTGLHGLLGTGPSGGSYTMRMPSGHAIAVQDNHRLS